MSGLDERSEYGCASLEERSSYLGDSRAVSRAVSCAGVILLGNLYEAGELQSFISIN